VDEAVLGFLRSDLEMGGIDGQLCGFVEEQSQVTMTSLVKGSSILDLVKIGVEAEDVSPTKLNQKAVKEFFDEDRQREPQQACSAMAGAYREL
jgi:hypothetical protein